MPDVWEAEMKKEDKVARNYEIVGLGNGGGHHTVIVSVDGEDPRDTGTTPREWIGSTHMLADGEVFDYLLGPEKKILRRGFTRGGKEKKPTRA